MTVILPGGLGQLKPAAGGSAWDPAHAWDNNNNPFASATFSNNNKTFTSTSTSAYSGSAVRGVKSNSAGKLYFEISTTKIGYIGNSCGLVDVNFLNQGPSYIIGGDNSGAQNFGVYQNGGATPQDYQAYSLGNAGTEFTSFLVANGDTIGFYCDLTSGHIYVSINNAYPIGNPSSTANAFFTYTPPLTLFPACSVSTDNTGAAGSNYTLATATPFKYTPFAGYSAWG